MVDLRVDYRATVGLIATSQRIYAHRRDGILTLRQAGRATAW
jgi:hypothetical protein